MLHRIQLCGADFYANLIVNQIKHCFAPFLYADIVLLNSDFVNYSITHCADCGSKMYYCTSNDFEKRQDCFVCSSSRKLVDACPESLYIRAACEEVPGADAFAASTTGSGRYAIVKKSGGSICRQGMSSHTNSYNIPKPVSGSLSLLSLC